MKILSVESILELVNRHGFERTLSDLMAALKRDFSRWDQFIKIPRPSMFVPGGVLELMPICDNDMYTFKYVNCHPKNISVGKQTIVATGQICSVNTGYPLMFSEMTILTALRTAATSALAADFMARKNSDTAAIIGCGAQSEFQIKALQLVRDIKEVRYFDIDEKAMDKFEKNMKSKKLSLVRSKTAKDAVESADIITVCTANKAHTNIIKNKWIKAGTHINGVGGDMVGKTELEFGILKRSWIVVEYFDQSFAEGEIQRLSLKEAKKRCAELHELVKGLKKGRKNNQEVTLFDSVGFAIEDYSVLRLFYELAQKYKIGQNLNITPELSDPKDLIGGMLY